MKALLLMVLIWFLIPEVRAKEPSYFSQEAAQERENRERQQEEEREREENIAKNLFGHPDESATPLNLTPNNLNQLDEARRRYWAAYEKGDPVELLAAKTVFSDLLFMRDLIALWTDPTVQDKPLDRFMAMTLNVVIPSGDGIPTSAQEYFAKWSIAFHGDIRLPGRGEATNINSIIDSFNRHFPAYAPYKIARDWAEDTRAPVPLPIEQFVFGLVQRWPYPAQREQAEKDYAVLLNIFGANRVFTVAEKVRSAMDQDGGVKDPAALGIDTSLATQDSEKVKWWRAELKRLDGQPNDSVTRATRQAAEFKLQESIREQNGEHTGYFAHNCYEVFWTLLTKDDPKLTALRQIYRARLKGIGGEDFGAFTYRTGKLSLQSIVDEWQAKPVPISTPTRSTQLPVASSLQWFTDKKSATTVAIAQHKKILVFVSLNDCEDCKQMEDIFANKSFVDYASQKLILLKYAGKRDELNEEEKAFIDRFVMIHDVYWGVFQPDLSVEIKSQVQARDERITLEWVNADSTPTITWAEVEAAQGDGSTALKKPKEMIAQVTPTPASSPKTMLPSPTPIPATVTTTSSSSSRRGNARQPFGYQTAQLTISNVLMTVEVANTSQKWQRGLMFRDSLPENQGMLFIFDQPKRATWWMKNIKIPLSVAFIDSAGTILEIKSMKPFDETLTPSTSDRVAFVLDANEGWFDRHGIKLGAKVQGIPSVTKSNQN